jgi:hypothetical protein
LSYAWLITFQPGILLPDNLSLDRLGHLPK